MAIKAAPLTASFNLKSLIYSSVVLVAPEAQYCAFAMPILKPTTETKAIAFLNIDFFILENEKLDIIYSFEVGFNIVVHELAHENLIKWEKININDILVEKNLLDYKVETLWSEIILNPEINDSIGEQLIIWELAFGLTFLCLKIQVVIDEYTFDYGSMLTWNDILGRRNE